MSPCTLEDPPAFIEDASGGNPAGVDEFESFRTPHKTMRARYLDTSVSEETLISGPMYFALPAVSDEPQISAPAGRTLRFADDPPSITTYVPEGDKGHKEWKKTSSQRSTNVPHYNLRTKGTSKKAAEEYSLLEKFSKHYHALVHASGEATVDYDCAGDDKWSGRGDQKTLMKGMILWTPENAYMFQHRDYDPTMPHVEFVWPTPVGRTKMLASVYPTRSSFMHVGLAPRGVRKITTC